MNLKQKLIEEAKKYIGVTEQGDNAGKMVEEFQKAVDGKAQHESWCCAFVMYCLSKVEQENGFSSILPKTEHCLTLWNNSPKECKSEMPKVGHLVVWQFYKEGKPTSNGHIGIVTSVDGMRIKTIEGNTGPSSAVERNGDGVYAKDRSIKGSETMKIVGYLNPFIESID